MFDALHATILFMIKSWKYKGLKLFKETGNKSGIQSKHANRLVDILDMLESAECPDDMHVPTFNLHKLIGNLRGYYSVTAQANWRVIFQFDRQDVILVDYLDYH